MYGFYLHRMRYAFVARGLRVEYDLMLNIPIVILMEYMLHASVINHHYFALLNHHSLSAPWRCCLLAA
jgi:hypothetical protein